MTTTELTAAALDLPKEERARLAQALIRSLDDGDGLSDEERHDAWDREVASRIGAWERGEATSRSAEQSFSDLRTRLTLLK